MASRTRKRTTMAETLQLIYRRLGSMEVEAKQSNVEAKITNARLESLEKSTIDRFESLEGSMNDRFESLEGSMNDRFESLEATMCERFDSLEKTTKTGFTIVKQQLDFVRGASVERHLDLDSRVKKLEKSVFGSEEPAR